MGKTFSTGLLTNGVWQDSSNNIGIGGAPSGSYKFEVTGTAKISSNIIFGGTLGNGTYTYTLPSATGTLALTSQLSSYVPTSRTLTINGVSYDLSADRSWTITAGISSVSGTAPISVSTVSGAATVSISQATTSTNGYLSSTDWNTFNGKQAQINGTGFVKASGTTISYDNSTYYLASNPSGFITSSGSTTGNAGSVTYLMNRTDVAAYPVLWGANYTNTIGTVAYSCAAVTIQSSTGTLSASYLSTGNITAVNGNSATFYGSGSVNGSAGIGMWVYTPSGSGTGAIMSFHRAGVYAVNFGLDSDNVMRIGGWSAGANRWQLDMSGNETIAGNYYGGGAGLTGTASSLSIGGNAATATGQQSSINFTVNTGGAGYGLVGVYNPAVHQCLFAMGPAYTLTGGGGLSNFYGVSWTYDNPGYAINTGYNLAHCMAVANAGTVYTVIGVGIWTSGLIRANGAISSGSTITATGNITGAYILGSYFNASAGNSENPTIGQIWTQNTSDNYLRKSTPAHFRSQITDGVYVYARSQSTWNDSTVINNVVGMLAWKNYGNAHVIFDASQSTSPSGTVVNATNPSYNWSASYPTLMGWNGAGTYGVRVDSARLADDSSAFAGYGSSSYLNKNGVSYYQATTWIELTGVHGLYCPSVNGAHFYPNNASSYTTWAITGSKGGYGGIHDAYSNVQGFMYDSAGNGGVYREANGRWYWYYLLGNSCMGIGTSTTSSSYGLYVSGGIYSTGDICAYSDARKKENIVTVENALDKVLKLRGVNYNMIDDETKTRKIGVIAQETEPILPEVVTYAADVDEYSVMYGNMSGLFIEAFKEQQTEIKEQRIEIQELKQLVNQILSK